ncbi:MAG: putative DNA binding domain-containing protein [Clostridiales bacterium]|jgi:ATP-dependent DNA helicase RecG|nr:putative DNA binding domain-containing protein [Clostridiales bacterium]
MDVKRFRLTLAVGENIAVEFKRGGKIDDDTYQTICSFLNRFGGDIYFGVEDNGTVCGVAKNAVSDIIKNIIKMVGNQEVINPTVYLAPEAFDYEGKTVVQIHIPPSSEVHTYKKTIYDRVDDADVKVTATGQIAQLYIRKQNVYTEKKIFPYIKDNDLRFDLISRVRQMAVNRQFEHTWKGLSDNELVISAGLMGRDAETGKTGYNLAAVMLLGKDDVIKSVCPTYLTDALLRKVNADRYDDRLIVETNLIESYDLLIGFAAKHLWDKFYLDGDARVSLRSAIAREMLVNSLMHREFTSSYIANFVIEKDKMYVSNANRAAGIGAITPDNFTPNPKNPIIAAFFRNIGYADTLGSGVRNLYKYTKLYSGKEPQFIEGDIFKIIVPLNDSYSFDTARFKAQSKDALNDGGTLNDDDGTLNDTLNGVLGDDGTLNDDNGTLNGTLNGVLGDDDTLDEENVIKFLRQNPRATQKEIAAHIKKSERTAKRLTNKLQEKGLLERNNGKRDGYWAVKAK